MTLAETVRVRPYTTWRFTVEDYHRLAEAGILGEDDRVELIEGDLVMSSPISSRHAACVKRLNALFSTALQGRAIVGVQDPLRLGEHSEPEPDLMLLRPREDFYRDAHPGPEDVYLVIEVSETSLAYDREVKLPLYARFGVPEVWLVNLVEDRLEVYRTPHGGSYTHKAVYTQGRVAPQAFPDLGLAVAAILMRDVDAPRRGPDPEAR